MGISFFCRGELWRGLFNPCSALHTLSITVVILKYFTYSMRLREEKQGGRIIPSTSDCSGWREEGRGAATTSAFHPTPPSPSAEGLSKVGKVVEGTTQQKQPKKNLGFLKCADDTTKRAAWQLSC